MIGALLPDDAIVVDEAVTASVFIQQATMGAGEHDYLYPDRRSDRLGAAGGDRRRGRRARPAR